MINVNLFFNSNKFFLLSLKKPLHVFLELLIAIEWLGKPKSLVFVKESN